MGGLGLGASGLVSTQALAFGMLGAFGALHVGPPNFGIGLEALHVGFRVQEPGIIVVVLCSAGKTLSRVMVNVHVGFTCCGTILERILLAFAKISYL